MLVHQLYRVALERSAKSHALRYQGDSFSYQQLHDAVERMSGQLLARGLTRGARVGIYAEKRFETVVAMLATSRVGGIFVPINPQLKSEQVAYIVRDCTIHTFITTEARRQSLRDALNTCPSVNTVWSIDSDAQPEVAHGSFASSAIDADPAAILYTSGSTGQPKGVILSHRNIVAGAQSVVEYLNLSAEDRLLCVLPLSFDYGLNQLTTALLSGACAVLINHLFASDIVKALANERITGLAGVPPLWSQVAALDWPPSINEHLRYFTNSGGHLSRVTLQALRAKVPAAKPFLMYGLTEAFRSTYLPPEDVDRCIDSIGKAIPNADVIVVRPDGSTCEVDEPGELVHRGVHVALGYWNDAARTAERFRPKRGLDGLPLPELAVWSGDTVRRDAEGYLYFVGRSDDMIKSSGYRVSPTEIEEAMMGLADVREVAAFGVPHATLGQTVALAIHSLQAADAVKTAALTAGRAKLPAWMVPTTISVSAEPLPRNANGKFDRARMAAELRRDSSSTPVSKT